MTVCYVWWREKTFCCVAAGDSVKGRTMNGLSRRGFAYRVACVCVALALQQGCRQDPPVTSWDCPRMLEVKKEWQTLHESFQDRSGTKVGYARKECGHSRASSRRGCHIATCRTLAATCESFQ